VDSYLHHIGFCFIHAIVSYAVRGTGGRYISKLSFGEKISNGNFGTADILTLYGGGPWRTKPTQGFIGFRFNNGAGIQYGWARIHMEDRGRTNAFRLLDYAYADPGEPLRAGQLSSDNDAVKENSLGGLALGAVGLLAWRKSRSRTGPLEAD